MDIEFFLDKRVGRYTLAGKGLHIGKSSGAWNDRLVSWRNSEQALWNIGIFWKYTYDTDSNLVISALQMNGRRNKSAFYTLNILSFTLMLVQTQIHPVRTLPSHPTHFIQISISPRPLQPTDIPTGYPESHHINLCSSPGSCGHVNVLKRKIYPVTALTTRNQAVSTHNLGSWPS